MSYDPNSESLPYATNSRTSQAAAQSMRANAMPIAKQIWLWIRNCRGTGATADEVAVAFQGLATHTTITARMRALKHSDLLRQPEGKTTRKTRSGRSATVWCATENDFSVYHEPNTKPSKKKFKAAFDEINRKNSYALPALRYTADCREVLDWLQDRYVK